MNNLKNNVVWNNVKATEEQIKGYINNYCKDFNCHYTNLVIDIDTVSFTTYSKITYESLVNKLVKEKYSDSEEFAILRKAIGNPNNDEYLIYNAFVEDCKIKARAFVEERDSKLAKYNKLEV